MVNLADLLWLRMAGAEYLWDGAKRAFVEK